MIEVELKAWVDDPVGVDAALAARFRFVGAYRKEDVYFRLGPATSPIEFRLRIDDGDAIVTSKEKRIDNGIEVNRETEFEVSDPTAFEAFARFLGAHPFVRKVKVGRLYEAAAGGRRAGDVAVAGEPRGAGPHAAAQPDGTGPRRAAGSGRPIHLELSVVERLGTFLEIEKLIESEDPSAVAEARDEIASLLANLGISSSKIEPRYYIDMLAALERGETVEPR